MTRLLAFNLLFALLVVFKVGSSLRGQYLRNVMRNTNRFAIFVLTVKAISLLILKNMRELNCTTNR